MRRESNVIIERDAEGYYVGSVPGCIREAIELCLEVQGDKLEPLDFVGVRKITVG